MRRLGLGLWEHGECLDVCPCLGCGGVGGVCGEWVGTWNRIWKSGVVLCQCKL